MSWRTMPDVTLTANAPQGVFQTAVWSPKGFNRRITRLSISANIAATGAPQQSNFIVILGKIIGGTQLGATTRGDINSADFTNPLMIPAGLITFFIWTALPGALIDPTSVATVNIGHEREV